METKIKTILECAIKAPSGHNTQPWKFKVMDHTIEILPDYSRRLPVVDADDHALFISLGCALENLLIAAHQFDWETKVSFHLEHPGKERIVVSLEKGVPINQNGLFESIPIRQSTRNEYDGKTIPEEDWNKIKKAALQEDVNVLVFNAPEEIKSITPFVKEGAISQFENKEFLKELMHWIRFNESKAEKTRDGLSSKVSGNPSVPEWLGKIFMGLSISPEKEAHKYEELILNSSGLMLFIAERNDKKAWINVGRSFERAMLQATALGVHHAHMNMPCEEVPVRKKLAAYLKLKDGMEPMLLIRLGYSEKMPYSFRRPLEEVLV
jgi:nitroreductase